MSAYQDEIAADLHRDLAEFRDVTLEMCQGFVIVALKRGWASAGTRRSSPRLFFAFLLFHQLELSFDMIERVALDAGFALSAANLITSLALVMNDEDALVASEEEVGDGSAAE